MSVICNFIGALLILVAPSYTVFIIASIFFEALLHKQPYSPHIIESIYFNLDS